MANEKGSEAAALPKLLLDIVEQVDGRDRETYNDDRKEEDEVSSMQEESIAHNLPKVLIIIYSINKSKST